MKKTLLLLSFLILLSLSACKTSLPQEPETTSSTETVQDEKETEIENQKKQEYDAFVARIESLIASAKDNYYCISKTISHFDNDTFTETTYIYDENCILTQESTRTAANETPSSTISGNSITYEYNKKGTVSRETHENFVFSFDPNIGANRRYDTKYILSYYYDSNNRISSIAYNGATASTFTYDPNGEYTATESGGETIHHYRPDGKLLWESLGGYHTSYQYLPNGEIESEITTHANETRSTNYSYEWDMDTKLQIVYDRHSNSNLNGKTTREYDEFGNCVKEIRYNSNGELETVTDYVFWTKADIISALNAEYYD